MSSLSKEQILAAIAERRKTVAVVSVPEWGGDVCIRRLNAAEVERTGLADGKRDVGVFTKVIAACLTDDDGAPLFTDTDAEALADADLATVVRVFGEVMRVNDLMDEDLEEALRGFSNAQLESSSTS